MNQHRIRNSGVHRGWTTRQMSVDALALDIAYSMTHATTPRHVEDYTTDKILMAAVLVLLQQQTA